MAGDNSRKGQKSKGHKNARPSQGESGSRPSVPWGHPPFYKGPPPPPPPPPSGGNDSAQQGTSSYGQHGASGYTAQSTSSDTHQDTDHETSHDAQQRAYQNDCQSSDHHIRGEPGYGWQQQSHIDVKPSTSYYAQQYYGAQAHGYGLEQGLGGDGQQETYYGTHRGTDRRAQHETSYDVPQGSGYNTPRNPQLDIGHNSSQYHQAGILASEEPNFGYSQDETGEPSVEILEGGSDAFYSSRPLGTYDSSTHDYHNSAEDQEPYDSPPDPDMKSQSSPRGQSRRKSASRSIGYGQQTPGSTANQEHMPYATTSSVDKSYRSSYDAETSQYSPDYTEHHATRPDYTSGNVYAGVPATAALHGSTDQVQDMTGEFGGLSLAEQSYDQQVGHLSGPSYSAAQPVYDVNNFEPQTPAQAPQTTQNQPGALTPVVLRVFDKHHEVKFLYGWMDPNATNPVLDRATAKGLRGKWESSGKRISTTAATLEAKDKLSLKWSGDGESEGLGQGTNFFYTVHGLECDFLIPLGFGN